MGSKQSTESNVNTEAAPADESPREPLVYLLGRSGHGKNSLLNALVQQSGGQANRIINPTSTCEETTVVIENGTSCKFIQSQKILEVNYQTFLREELTTDLVLYKPSVILYVVSCSEIKSIDFDMKSLTELFKSKKDDKAKLPSVIVVLTKADIFYHQNLWPIEDHITKQDALKKLLDFTSKAVLHTRNCEQLQKECMYYGYRLVGCEPFLYVLPAAVLLPEIKWNIHLLHNVLTKPLQPDFQPPYDFGSDIRDLQNILGEVQGLFEALCNKHAIVGDAYEKCRNAALYPIIAFLKEFIENARSPIVYLIGRSGHGKSSLINTLLNAPMATVGHVAPTTANAEEYDILFKGQDVSWKIIDSRGIFESTVAKGAAGKLSATEQLEKDLKRHTPDIILHLITCSEVRSMSEDIPCVYSILNKIKDITGAKPPVIAVLTKTDPFYDYRQWPIEEYEKKQTNIVDLLEYFSTSLEYASTVKFFEPTTKYYGCKLSGSKHYLYAIPVAALTTPPTIEWNVERLSELIGSELPKQTWLHYYKSQKKSSSMKALALKVVNALTPISAAIGAIPLPGLSLILLPPLYIIMITIIAKLAGREFSTAAAREYLKACKFWQGGAIVAGTLAAGSTLAIAEFFVIRLFGIGCALAAPMAGGVTYGVGRAVIAYFFDDQIKEPKSYTKEWNPTTA